MTTHYSKKGNCFIRILSGMLVGVILLLQPFDADAQRRSNSRKENSSIALGGKSTYQIINGKLWAWGKNNYGQLGNGSTTDSYTPIQIGTATDWMSVSAGENFAIALKANGTVWSWGQNAYGQLGYVTSSNQTSPQQIGSDTWLMISAGVNYVSAIKSDGTLWAWGDKTTYFNGWLNSNVPVNVSSEKFVFTDAGDDVTFAIKADGSLYGWGISDHRGLLYGRESGWPNYPFLDAGPWLSVSVGGSCGVGIKSDGSLWTWGRYTGNGDGTVAITTPIRIGTDTWANVTAVDYNNTFAIKTDGTLWSWGRGFPVALGDGGMTPHYTPYQISIDSWVSVVPSYGTHAAALKADGTLWVWGMNLSGEVGNGFTTEQYTPFNVSTGASLDSWQVLTSGYYHTAGIKSDGTLWTWGANNYGQLGDGATIDRSCPTQIGTNKWIDVSAGISHTIAIKADGTLWAWGYNGYGQLGTGTYTNQSSPVQIGTDKWIAVSAGNTHTAAIRADGRLFTWGYNDYGKLGDNTTTQRLVPTLIGTYTWVKVTAGAYHTAAIASDGSLWTFGFNGAGILGDGTTIDRHAPVRIGNDSWVSVSAGEFHTHAIKADGTLHSWGYNAYGHLGDGTTTYKTSPVQIGSDTWRFISASKYAGGAAIKSNGSLWGWGFNNQGQIGDGSMVQRLSPVEMLEVVQGAYRTADPEEQQPLTILPFNITNQNWLVIAAGYQSTIGFKADRINFYSAGTNGNGQMGRNLTVSTTFGINRNNSYNIIPVNKSSYSEQNICSGQSTTLRAGDIGGSLQWYTVSSGGSPVGVSPNFSTPALYANTTYYVQSTAVCNTPNLREAIEVTVSSCARVSGEPEEESIENTSLLKIYPNPTTGSFILKGYKQGEYSLVNEWGQTLQVLELNAVNNYTLSIQNLSNGLYTLIGPDNTLQQRIVVIK